MGNCPEKSTESAQSCRVPPDSSDAVRIWLNEQCLASGLQTTRISFAQSRQWQWDRDGFLSHYTKRFFRVVGVRYFSLFDNQFQTQPIIDQPEIGLLSFLVCKENHDWWILAHAKAEPGNVNGVQLAPTVQATKSNYEIAHGGAATPYLQLAKPNGNCLCNQLQSEQNSRFLAKRNRNSVVRVDSMIPAVESHYRWIRLRQLLPLLRESHQINTDARSVLACWLFTDMAALTECAPSPGSFAGKLIHSLHSESALHTNETLQDWLAALNQQSKACAQMIPLRDLEHPWECGDAVIASPHDPAMIHQIEVQCPKREVAHWDQPIAASRTQTQLVLVMGSHKGTLHLLLQARLEAGNRSGFELTTTVQSEPPITNPVELRYVELANNARTFLQFENSEEGGRFDRCISEYRIAWLDDVNESHEGPFHRWVSLSQFADLLANQSFITNELRSAVSSLLSFEHNE